jgi:hypothetical protein
MVLRIAKRWPAVAACVLSAAGVAQATPWHRESFLNLSVGVNVVRPDFRPSAGDSENLTIWDGRVVVRAPRIPAADLAAYAAEADARLRSAFDGTGWSVPFDDSAPLRILVTSSTGLGFSNVSVVGRDPMIVLNIAGHPSAESAAETTRNVAILVLHAAAPAAGSEVLLASARAMSLGDEFLESDREELREMGAGPAHSLEARGSELFAASWIREMGRSAGPDFLRGVWTDRVARGEASLSAYAAAFHDLGGTASEAFYRTLARLYGGEEVFGDPSKLSEIDLATGALNASSPGTRAWRFFTSLPASGGGWGLSWPEDAARGFAVLHYEDGLPSDIVPFSPGDRKILPSAGVERIDWIILGRDGAPALLAAPVALARETEFPFSGLSAGARTEAGEGVVLSWQTASHRDLAGWAILRSEVTESGRVIQANPESLPAQMDDRSGAAYDFVDTSATPGHYYRYDVWAITADGALSRAFRTTLQAQ